MTDTTPLPRTTFTQMDAGEQREFLAGELALWRTEGYWSPARAQRFYRRVGILARKANMSFTSTLRFLKADAEVIEANSD
jgi:hypothetical protein